MRGYGGNVCVDRCEVGERRFFGMNLETQGYEILVVDRFEIEI